jgi:uncharacterized protein YaiL (DUF2058 family)
MGNSLQEQLLKAGLVSEQQLKQTKTTKRKQKRGGEPDAGDAARREADKAAAAKQARDRELNRKRDEETRRKTELVAIWQLIRDNRVPRNGADIAYNFSDGKALKRLYVSAAQQRDIVEGKLAIVRQDAFYEVVPGAVAERAAAHDASLVLVHNKSGMQDEDDDYADYKVPDDLMW